MRSHAAHAAATRTACLLVQVFPPRHNGLTLRAAGLEQFAVHMNHLFRPGSFKKIIDVLRAKEEPAAPFRQPRLQASQRSMSLVWLSSQKVLAAHVVEGVDLLRVKGEGFRRGELHRVE